MRTLESRLEEARKLLEPFASIKVLFDKDANNTRVKLWAAVGEALAYLRSYDLPDAVLADYRCGQCGLSGVKLWREYSTFYDKKDLRCAVCACAKYGEDVSKIDSEGRSDFKGDGMRSDSIHWLVPCVPDTGGSVWGYTSVPPEACRWWKDLPTIISASGG
jgi:hypothetical protein